MNNKNRKSIKNISMLITCLTVGLFGYGQTVQQQIEKQVRDPQRKENAGKADVIISRQKTVFDSTTFKNDTIEATNNKMMKGTPKKKHCYKTKQPGKTNILKKET